MGSSFRLDVSILCFRQVSPLPSFNNALTLFLLNVGDPLSLFGMLRARIPKAAMINLSGEEFRQHQTIYRF